MELICYTFRGTLLLKGALHIGSGGSGRVGSDDSMSDATVVRDSHGQAYIPGSSLRGVLRSAVSSYASALFAQNRLGEFYEDEDEREEQIRKEIDRLGLNPAEKDVQTLLDGFLSPAERLFGTVFWASPLLIPDLYPANNAAGALPGEIRHGVGIDRDTGAARDTAKYDFEVLPSGQRFELLLRCEMPKVHEDLWTKLLAIGLRLLEQGQLNLGGRLARGVGQVELHDLQVYRLAFDRASLRAALLAGDEGRYGAQLEHGWPSRVLEVT